METIVSAQTDLQSAVEGNTAATAANTSAINDAIAKLGSPVSGVPEDVVAAAAAVISANTATIQDDAARLAAAPVVVAPAA